MVSDMHMTWKRVRETCRLRRRVGRSIGARSAQYRCLWERSMPGLLEQLEALRRMEAAGEAMPWSRTI
jgi:hypothetical protein